jgi:hypothetical protein
MLQNQEIGAGVRDQDEKKNPGKINFHIKVSRLTSFKVVTESKQEVQLPSWYQVAADSCPKKVIATELKWHQSEKSGRFYITTKHDWLPQKTINWRSPTFWPIIDMVAHRQIGKPNITKLVA